jgi:hypothetical protein
MRWLDPFAMLSAPRGATLWSITTKSAPVMKPVGLLAVILIGCAFAQGQSRDSMAPIQTERRASLTKRTEAYVKANQEKKLEALYHLVSDTGRGGVDRQTFIVRMNAAHARDFATVPDLLAFRIERVNPREERGFDLYGCGTARREGKTYEGIVVTHVVLERNDWFFTGWTFTRFPNEPCKNFAKPEWDPEDEDQIPWKLRMVELRSTPNLPSHLDQKP